MPDDISRAFSQDTMVRWRRFLAILPFVVVPVVLAGQQPTFDVVSIKRAADSANRMLRPSVGDVRPGGVWSATDATVNALVRYAYPGHPLNAQVVGLPDWARRDFFDVEARGNPAATGDDWRLMVRAMLADRFRLALHIERREVTGYALVRRADGRLGSGITTPAFDCDAYRAAKARGETPREDPARKPYGDRLSCVAIVMPVIDHVRLIPGADSRLTAGSATIATVAGLLARQLGVPVEDRTGLTGVFDVELQFSNLPPRIDVENGPPLRSAVSEQLGLRLDEQKVTVDVLVIDRVEQPTPN